MLRLLPLAAFGALLCFAAAAHNNPTFREDLLATVEVSAAAQDGAHSAPFSLTLPDKTVQLVWRIAEPAAAGATFTVAQNGERVAEKLGHDSPSGRLQGEGFRVTQVADAGGDFTLQVYAKVLDRSQPAAVSAADLERGKNVYRDANCVGCHKWHGNGGGGYGGAAGSLRKTTLDATGLKLLVRCGRPSTGMPYHQRGAYQGDNKDCYNTTGSALGEATPPRAAKFLRESQVDAVVAYVLAAIKDRGEPTFDECTAFWGERSRQCDAYKP